MNMKRTRRAAGVVLTLLIGAPLGADAQWRPSLRGSAGVAADAVHSDQYRETSLIAVELDGSIELPTNAPGVAVTLGGRLESHSRLGATKVCVLLPTEPCLPLLPTFTGARALVGLQYSIASRTTVGAAAGFGYLWTAEMGGSLLQSVHGDIARVLAGKMRLGLRASHSTLPRFRGHVLRMNSLGLFVTV
jgi:hypothetical protein